MLSLTCATGPYDRTEALRDGRVRPEGIELTCLTLSPEEMFFRQLRYQEFDVSELSLSKYIMMRAAGDDRFIALPVFPSRSFRHRNIFVRADRGIAQPRDLAGRRIGVPEYSMTAAVWVRGLLKDEYGVGAADITWVQAGQEQPGRAELAQLDLSRYGIHLETVADRSLSEMLVAGDIDAMISAKEPSCYRRSPHVLRLIEDYRPVEEDYFRRTGVFPIMHCVVVRQSLYRQYPWMAQSLTKAFAAAKDMAQDRLRELGALSAMLPWLPAEVARLDDVMGPDWWPYGIEPNLPALTRLLGYQAEQGLIKTLPVVEELFAPSTLRTFKV